MAFNLKIRSIPDLNKKLKIFLFCYLLALSIISIFVMSLFFNSYDAKSRQLSSINQKNKISKFLSNYENQIISIASQPTFRNLLGADPNMLNTINLNDPFFYGIKRQIASLTAKYKKDTIFDGTAVFNDQDEMVFKQGSTSTPYFVTFKLCYRDSVVSYNKGTPCLGKWTFFINKNKLLNNLKKDGILITSIKKDNIPITHWFYFDIIKLNEAKLPSDLFLKIDIENKIFKYIISIIIIVLFLSMVFLVRFILTLYNNNYFRFISEIHNHLSDDQLIQNEKYTHCPSEVFDLVLAVNNALKIKKIEAIENLAHDLKPPLKRLQLIASKIDNPLKQDVLNIHSQCYLAINKLHNTALENMCIQKIIHDCVFSIYMEQYDNEIILLDLFHEDLFCKINYSHFVRVLSNLINNALKSIEKKDNPKITIRLSEEYCHFKISIIDNGCGISPEIKDKIFLENVSFTGSSGKGLSYSKKMIESWNGTIGCSTKEEGTVFTITLPISKAPFDYIQNIYYSEKSRFIIIDDEPYFHKYLSKKIPTENNITHIYNPNQLTQFFFNYTLLPHDIFIIDYNFHSSINGFEIIDKYKLLGQAYLASTSTEHLKERYNKFKCSIPMLPKRYFNLYNFIKIQSIDAVLIDDDIEVLKDAKDLSKIHHINLLTLNNFLQLKMVLPLLSKKTPITLDNNIENTEETGIYIASHLFKQGFHDIYIQSGDNINTNYSYIKSILDKGDFFYDQA